MRGLENLLQPTNTHCLASHHMRGLEINGTNNSGTKSASHHMRGLEIFIVRTVLSLS